MSKSISGKSRQPSPEVTKNPDPRSPRRPSNFNLRSLGSTTSLTSATSVAKSGKCEKKSPTTKPSISSREPHIEDDGAAFYTWKKDAATNKSICVSTKPRFKNSSSDESEDESVPNPYWTKRFDEEVKQIEEWNEKERRRRGVSRVSSSSSDSSEGEDARPQGKAAGRSSRSAQASNAGLAILNELEKSASSILRKHWQAEGHQTATNLLAGLPTVTRNTLIQHLNLAAQSEGFGDLTSVQQKQRLRERVGKPLVMSVANDLVHQLKSSGTGKFESSLASSLSVSFGPGTTAQGQAAKPDLLDQLIDQLVESSVAYEVSKTIDLAPELFHPAYWRDLQNDYLVKPKLKESVESLSQHQPVSDTFVRDFKASVYRYRSLSGRSIAIESIQEFADLTGKHSMQVSHLACQNLSLFLSRAIFCRIKPDGRSDSALHLADGTPVTPMDRMVASYELSHNLDGTISMEFTGTIDTRAAELQASQTRSIMKHTAKLHKPEREQRSISDSGQSNGSSYLENIDGKRVVIRNANLEIKVKVDFDDHGQPKIGQVALNAQGWDKIDDSV